MESADITVDSITIQPAKAAFILRTHHVEEEDILEVFANAPVFYLFDARWMVYDMVGPNRYGRFLVVGIQRIDGNDWRVVTAYWNTDGRAEKIYEALK